MEVQVNLLKKQLVLAQQSCLLSLIQLEKDRNPHGTNDNHRYEDLREEIAKAGQQRIKKVEVKAKSRANWFKIEEEKKERAQELQMKLDSQK